MGNSKLHVTIHIDGGARGNPGPAAAGVVILDAADGQAIYEGGLFLGKATNNQAEYNGLLSGLKQAIELGAVAADVFSDSELMVKQINGQYRVKNQGLRPLFEEAKDLAARLESFNIQHVRRENNKDADRLVNEALDAKRNVEDAAV